MGFLIIGSLVILAAVIGANAWSKSREERKGARKRDPRSASPTSQTKDKGKPDEKKNTRLSGFLTLVGSAAVVVLTVALVWKIVGVRDRASESRNNLAAAQRDVAKAIRDNPPVSTLKHFDTTFFVSKKDSVKFMLPRYRCIAMTPDSAAPYAIRTETFRGQLKLTKVHEFPDPSVRHAKLPFPLRSLEFLGRTEKPLKIFLKTYESSDACNQVAGAFFIFRISSSSGWEAGLCSSAGLCRRSREQAL